MNKRQKKKARKKRAYPPYVSAKRRKKNKYLCERYCFLIPYNVWTGKVFWMRKPYDWTLAESFPKGWWKAFGIQFCEELRAELIKYNFLKEYRAVQIKEKYARLRFYDNGYPKDSEVSEIIGDYSALSENICIVCGRPDTPVIIDMGWYEPVCKSCYEKRSNRKKKYIKEIPKYEDLICDDTFEMPNERTYTLYYNRTEETITRDISSKANQIRARWRTAHEHN